MFDERDTPRSTFDRLVPRVGPLEAVRRHKLITILPAIVFVGLALVYGLLRTPVYTAEARQTIGRIDVSQPGALSGFSSATRALASTYSRAVVAPAIVASVSRTTGLSSATVRDRLASSPIPESSVIRVTGTGPTSEQAIAVSSAGARALERFVAQLNRNNPNADRLFREFRTASRRQAELRDELARVKGGAGSAPTAAQSRRISSLRERVASADLTVVVLGENYRDSRRSESNVSILQTISLPQEASSDRSSRLQLVLFMALVLGLLMGVGLASLRANLEVRRALTTT